MGYSRTPVANAEAGHARIGRSFMEACRPSPGSRELFARGFDRVQRVPDEIRGRRLRRPPRCRPPANSRRPRRPGQRLHHCGPTRRQGQLAGRLHGSPGSARSKTQVGSSHRPSQSCWTSTRSMCTASGPARQHPRCQVGDRRFAFIQACTSLSSQSRTRACLTTGAGKPGRRDSWSARVRDTPSMSATSLIPTSAMALEP